MTKASQTTALRSGASRHIAITAGGLAVLLGALDTYVVITIIRDIMSDVGIPANKIQQVGPIITWYLLGYIAAMPLLGRASDRFGRKLLLQVSLAGFAVGSVITALAGEIEFSDSNNAYNMLIAGRFLQGIASGALLPVTLALAADLWSARNRASVLGGIGAAQELGSVVGPLYGIAIVALFARWEFVFWVNVPLAILAMVLIHFTVPSKSEDDGPREKVDVGGGLLLALALGLTVWGLYNPEPSAQQALPDNGIPLLIGAAVAMIAFFVWEKFARTRLIEPAGVKFGPFFAALGASLCAGAALMVTLVNVELFAQGVLGKDQIQAAFMLMWFLVALPFGAVLGGLLATRIGDRIVGFVGLMIAGSGYLLVAQWRTDLLTDVHNLELFTLPVLGTDLIITGFGLGMVIGPLTSATLRVVPSAQHGVASSAVIVARMTGMLIGVAALSAWGLYRFNQILATKEAKPASDSLADVALALAARVREAFAEQYGEIFAITAGVCVVGALLSLLIAGKHTHVDEPKTDEPKTEMTDVASNPSGRQRAE
ncbi:MAG: MFS transporter [Mycobacterium sp.]